MRYAHKTYTQGSVAFIHHGTGYHPGGQVDDFNLSVEIVDVDDPADLTFDRDGDVEGGINEYITNSSISINVFQFKSALTERKHFNMDLFTDSLPILDEVLPVFKDLADVETIETAIEVFEQHGFKPSGYHLRAQGTKWLERQAP